MDRNLAADIKARLTVEDVVGGYLDLKKSGSSYKALSPFKAEKTPSFIVTPAKEIWKDFSSGRGGDIFTFIMEYEGVSYVEALRILAEKAGLNMADYNRGTTYNPQATQIRQTTLEVLEKATLFYEQALKKSTTARTYLRRRGFKAATIAAFRLGYAPSSWQALHDYLLKEDKESLRYANLAGLLSKREVSAWKQAKNKKANAQWGDFFVDRLMIPLSDSRGATIGFTARQLKTNKKYAKYINSRQTFLYNKSKHVFGYHQARDAIRQAGFALVVEGNLDVIACYQAGYKQTVAAGGTALTLQHLRIIGRLTDDVRLAFDGDEAGTDAMERSLYAASQAGISLAVVSLPKDMDPDDLIKQNFKLWQQIVDQHQPAPDWLYDKYKAQLDLKTAAGKKKFTDIMLPIVNCLNDEVEKEHYLEKLEKEGIKRTALEKKMKQVTQEKILPAFVQQALQDTADDPVFKPADVSGNLSETASDLHLLLGLLLIEPRLRQHLEPDDDLKHLLTEKIYEDVSTVYTFVKKSPLKIETTQRIPQELKPLTACVKLLLQSVEQTPPALQERYSESPLEVKQEMYYDLRRQLGTFSRRLTEQNKQQ